MSLIHKARLDTHTSASPALPSASAASSAAPSPLLPSISAIEQRPSALTLNPASASAQSLLATPSHTTAASMAAMSLATPSSSSSSSAVNHPLFSSPVLATPELYRRAGWVAGAEGSAADSAGPGAGYLGPDGGPQRAAGVNLFDISALRTVAALPHGSLSIQLVLVLTASPVM
jgi:hypothetical protein